jgi:hypothetical protein
MPTQFLELKDGIFVEIGSPMDRRQEMHASTAEQVDTTMEIVGRTLSRILRPLGEAFGGLYEALDVPVAIESAEIELGLSFSAEGSLFVAKSKAEGNLNVKVKFKTIEKS